MMGQNTQSMDPSAPSSASRAARRASTLLLLLLGGCSFYMRGPDDYRKAVRQELEGQTPQIESCYRAQLKTDEAAKGKVTVKFEVAPKTGAIGNASVVEGESQASDALKQCVLAQLNGLKVSPPDQRKGEATFSWDFAR
jgi:hypothetical protein